MDQTLTPVMRRGKKERGLFSCSLFGLGVAMLLICGLSLIGSVWAYGQDNPSGYILPLSYTIAFVSAFLGGWFSARMRGKQGLICGLLTGVGMLVAFSIGLLICMGDQEVSAGQVLLFYLLLLLVTILGGIIGGARMAKPRRKRRH